MAAAAILDFGKTVDEKILTPIFQVSVTLPEHKSVTVLLLTIIVLLEGFFEHRDLHYIDSYESIEAKKLASTRDCNVKYITRWGLSCTI